MQEESRYFSFNVETVHTTTEFTCYNNQLSKDICFDILTGKTYPFYPFVEGVSTVVDIGANVGAASVYFRSMYPGAAIYAFEPHHETFSLLQRNIAPFEKMEAFNYGLFDQDKEIKLFKGKADSVTNSIYAEVAGSDGEFEMVKFRSSAAVMRKLGLGQIDILKMDTEGCETQLLMSLYPFVTGAKIIYIEYHSENDRLFIDGLLTRTHYVCFARANFPHRGELVYLNKNITFADSRNHERVD